MNRLKTIEDYYNDRKYCELEYQKLGWESQMAQLKRFDALESNIDLKNKKLLDVGCGCGCLFRYLKEKNIQVEYTGVDILPHMIDFCKSKYSSGDFLNIDIFKSEETFERNAFDIVFVSGIFNINLGNNLEFLRHGLTKLYSYSKDLIVFNLLSTESLDKEDNYFYFNSKEVVKDVKDLFGESVSISVLEDYLDNDFTVVLRKLF